MIRTESRHKVATGHLSYCAMNALWHYLRRSVQVAISLIAVLSAGFLAHWLVIEGAFDGPFRNPYEADDICFIQNQPGATSRYVEYSFMTCSEPHLFLGEPVGADQAVLTFPDLEGDGHPEAVIESSHYKCKYGGLGCYGAERIVLEICPACDPKVRVVKREPLPQLEWGHGP